VAELLTTKQLQDLLQIDRTTVYRVLKDGRLTGVKVDSRRRFDRSQVEAILNRRDRPRPAASPRSAPRILPAGRLQGHSKSVGRAGRRRCPDYYPHRGAVDRPKTVTISEKMYGAR